MLCPKHTLEIKGGLKVCLTLPQLAATPNQGVSLTGPDGTYTMSGLVSQAQDSQS